MTPIERAAQAICNVQDPDRPPDCFETHARAALAAIEEPSEAMIEAGANA